MKKRIIMILLSIMLLAEGGCAVYLLNHYDFFRSEDNETNDTTAEMETTTLTEEFVVEEEPQETESIETPEVEENLVSQSQQITDVSDDLLLQSEETEVSTNTMLSEEYFSSEAGKTAYNNLLAKQQGNYAFSMMDTRYQKIYVEILCIVQNLGQGIEVSSTSVSDIDYAFQCVLSDHPEIFYVDGYTYTTYSQGSSIIKILLSGNYTMTVEEIQAAQIQIEQAVMICISGIDASASEYEKVKYIYEYLVNNTQYNIAAPQNQNICSVFLYKESVCQGYAKAMQYLLNRINVFCTLVVGTVEDGTGHAWNLVSVDGNYYFVDVTWGDAFYVFEGEQQVSTDKVPTISYDYLCVTTQQLTATHSINNPVEIPWCVSMDANYYQREKAYFTQVDQTQIAELFRVAYASGKELVTLKCSDNAVFTQMVSVLIEEQGVFQYLADTENSVAYADSEEQLSLTFWLN